MLSLKELLSQDVPDLAHFANQDRLSQIAAIETADGKPRATGDPAMERD